MRFITSKANSLFPLMAGAVVLSMSCNSPLLNHADANDHRNRDNGQFSDESCPLAFPAAKLCASITFASQPVEREDNEAVVRFWSMEAGSASGPYVSPTSDVGVELWMPSMGHGSAKVKVNPARDSGNAVIPGVFDAMPIYFVMGGDWEVWVQLKQGKKVIERAKIDLML